MVDLVVSTGDWKWLHWTTRGQSLKKIRMGNFFFPKLLSEILTMCFRNSPKVSKSSKIQSFITIKNLIKPWSCHVVCPRAEPVITFYYMFSMTMIKWPLSKSIAANPCAFFLQGSSELILKFHPFSDRV